MYRCRRQSAIDRVHAVRWCTPCFVLAHPMLRAAADSLPWTLIAPEPSGARVGDYRMIRLLGHGGMADVWLAEWQTGAQGRLVALKRISPDLCRDPMVVRMFLGE